MDGVVRRVDGDGYPDLAVGAPLRTVSELSSCGAIDVFRGGPGFGTRWLSLGGEAANDWFGQSVTLGDLDGDGKAEIIVGAPYNDRAASAAGAVFIYKGGSTPPTTPWLVLTGENANDQFGWSVAYVGDVDGDGYGDLVVGARLYGLGLLAAQGKVYLFHGGPTMDAVADGSWAGVAKDDWFGNSVAGSGDVDGRGRPDILVGAPYNDAAGSAAGAAYLFRGEDPPGSPPAAVYFGESANAQLGWTVSGAGDVDGDGYPDVLTGARLQASGALSAVGRIYLFSGGTSLATAPIATADGEAADDWFGNSVSDGTGFFFPGHGAAFGGAPHNDAAASAAGRAYNYGYGLRVGVDEKATTAPLVGIRVSPNPTSRMAAIRWTVRAAIAGIDVYDVQGRRVRKLDVAGEAGGVEWDLRDESGKRVAQGIYLIAARSRGSAPLPVHVAPLAVLR